MFCERLLANTTSKFVKLTELQDFCVFSVGLAAASVLNRVDFKR